MGRQNDEGHASGFEMNLDSEHNITPVKLQR